MLLTVDAGDSLRVTLALPLLVAESDGVRVKLAEALLLPATLALTLEVPVTAGVLDGEAVAVARLGSTE